MHHSPFGPSDTEHDPTHRTSAAPRPRSRRGALPLVLTVLVSLAVSCGSDAPAAGEATSTTTTVPEPNVGGFGAPAAAPDEFGQLPGIEMTGRAELDSNGCWYLSGNGESGLLVAPTGTRLGDDGQALVGPDGTVIDRGASVDIVGGLVALTDLPGGSDGRWANYVRLCDPSYGSAVVADSLTAAFDPADVAPADLAAQLDASLFDTDYGCGFGFTTGDTDGRWALRINVTTGTPPEAGPVGLPDDRFDVVVTAGAHLFSNHCDDVMEWFEPEYAPAVEWAVTAGDFTYPVTSGEMCSGEPPATITLVGATVATPGGPKVLDPIEITNTAFGCFAG
jgi:hypothetical protein